MGRKKKFHRRNEHECFVCRERFDAVRDDARFCSARCRQRSSRQTRLLDAIIGPKKKKKKSQKPRISQ